MKISAHALMLLLCSSSRDCFSMLMTKRSAAVGWRRTLHHLSSRPSSYLLVAATGTPLLNSKPPAASLASSTSLFMQNTCPWRGRTASTSPFLLMTRGGSRAMSSSTALNSAVATTTAEQKGTKPPMEIFRQDYQPLPYAVAKIHMDIVIREGKTQITSKLFIQPNHKIDKSKFLKEDWVLDGDETSVKLLQVLWNGRELVSGIDYSLEPGKLRLHPSALVEGSSSDGTDGGVLTTVVEIVPETNTQLSGLYKSSDGIYCTQCEAMGFRRMTYYPDRPDNMAVFERIRLEASRKDYPVLLSNGNLMEQGDVKDDNNNNKEQQRHYAIWQDPFPKPSYLFCCVAGQLDNIRDTFQTKSGRNVQLQIFSEPSNVHKLHYAMESLKRSMKWDEDRFGLEYDLDLFNIVAVESFNMGAMENKGLNVFNTAYVLADRETATDVDFERVEGVIGHEYFHNWTGNRVTCRDWFQLTLKEGLTVFRDQEFSGDMNSRAVKRIEDVRILRGRQFNEDAGPMSHPIRPESYISMDNFYTATVYNKGAEVIRMYQTLLTTEGFRKGMDLYFQRHDGSAVTCDDFLAAMADANQVDLSQFALWYSTPGTPTVTYSTSFDSSTGTFSITLTQSNKVDKPLHIPVAVGLLDKESGKEVVPTTVLELKETSQTFPFPNLKGDVVPSILRDFSAPVKLVPISGTEDESALAFLAARDTNGFNKWEAGQKLYTSLIFQHMRGNASKQTNEYVMEAFGRTLADKGTDDYSIQAYALMLPSEATLAELVDVVDPVAIHNGRQAVKVAIARKFQAELMERYKELTAAMNGKDFKVDAKSIGERRLRNVLLDYLCSIKETPDEQLAAAEIASQHFNSATGMTDKMAALSVLASMDGQGAPARDAALEKFYQDANGDALVLNKWFSVQAIADLPDVLDRVKKLKQHPDFTLLNPNRCRSLIASFAMNPVPFHDVSGNGYHFLSDILAELDPLNPQISSRLASSLIQWRRYDEKRGQLMKAELEKLANMKPISNDLYEVVSRGLK